MIAPTTARPYHAWRIVEGFADRLLFAAGGRDRTPHTGAPERMLLMRHDLIGDFILFTGTLRSYREAFPRTRIVLLVRDHAADLARASDDVDEVWSLPNRAFRLDPTERLRWWRRMRDGAFDLAVNAVYGTSWVHLDALAGWTRAPRRVVHECLDPRAPRRTAHPYFTETVPARGAWRFSVERDLDLLEHLTGVRPPRRDPFVAVLPQWREEARRLAGEGPYGVVAPGARYEIKRWGAGQFAEALALAEGGMGLRWLVAGSAGEAGVCRELTGLLVGRGIPALDLAGRVSLGPLAALLASARVSLGNDSAPAHLAAAVGTPGVAVVGGGHPGVCYPYPGNPLTIAVRHELPCYHCSWYCTRPENECITGVTPRDVAGALVRIRDARRTGEGGGR
jgi:ADP-heptose:LPS heptosyltransferase